MSSPDPSRDDDELFRQIVEGWGTEAADPVPRWPVSEDVSDDEPRPTEAAAGPSYPVGGVPPEEALPGWVEPAALEDDGHYVPPDPPRLPRPRLRTVFGVLVLLLGLAMLLTPYQLGLDDSGLSVLLGLAVTGGGATVLVLGMRDAPGHDDDPDGGAVV